MTGTTRRNTNAAFHFALLGGMMLYLALATAGFAILGATRVLPDMIAHAQWLSVVSITSGAVAIISFFLSKR